MKKTLNNFSVKNKILIIIGVNLISLLILGVISFFGLQRLNKYKDQISLNSKALQFQQSADMMHDALRGDCYKAMLLDKSNPEKVKNLQEEIKEHSLEFRTQIKDLKNLPELPAKIKKAVLKVESPLNNYIVLSNQLIKEVLRPNYVQNSPSFQKVLKDFNASFGALETKMENLSDFISTESIIREKEGDEFAKKIKTLIIILISIVFVVVILISLFVSNLIVKPINETKSVLDKLSVGDDVDTIEVNSTDEIGSMIHSINSVVDNLNAVKEYVSEVGSGNFNTEIEIFNNQGAIYHSLDAMRNSLKQTTEDEKKRNWATEGLAMFGDILRGNNDGINVLADNIISGLVKYLKANQGGIFVVNDNDVNDTYLELIACYAWNKKKYINMRVDQGEGLVGQAWQENDTLYITDVPQDFVKITSGLGDANPNSFLIVPLTVNDETFGVIEIASFNLFEPYQIEFVQKLAESIASTLSTAKTNERTKVLLEQSQQQTEEMRAQEEEMRQNMEEMQATQEEMERKEEQMGMMLQKAQQQEEEIRQNMEEMAATQEEMEKQNVIIAEKAAETQSILDGINATMATIEFTPDGTVVTANDNFLQTMKVSLSDIIGKHHRNFVPTEIANSVDYQRLWPDLAKGMDKKGEFKRINGAGEIVWLNAIYNPIFNADNQVIKVIKFATDITAQKALEAEQKAQSDIINDIAIVSKTDLQGNITYVNEEFLKWSKYSLEEVMGKNHRMLKSGDQSDQIFVDMWKTISSGKTFRGEIKNKAKDGSFYWVDAIIAPILDENGKPKEYIAQRFVINEQKAKEQESGAQKAILDQICIISKTDLQGNITYVNDEFLKWSKYTKEEVMGKNHRMLKSGDQDDQIFVDMWKTISSGKIFRGEIKNKAKDGSFYWVDAIVAPVLDDKGKPVEYMAQRFVINEQKEKERLMQELLDKNKS